MQDASIELLERGIMKPPAPTTAGETSPLIESAELVDILMVAYKSLCESGLPTVADGAKKTHASVGPFSYTKNDHFAKTGSGRTQGALSLKQGFVSLAGTLRDLIRQLKCFGLSLLPLDCRNESVRHSEALDAITRYLGIGSYISWCGGNINGNVFFVCVCARHLIPRTNRTSAKTGSGQTFERVEKDDVALFLQGRADAPGLAAEGAQ